MSLIVSFEEWLQKWGAFEVPQESSWLKELYIQECLQREGSEEEQRQASLEHQRILEAQLNQLQKDREQFQLPAPAQVTIKTLLYLKTVLRQQQEYQVRLDKVLQECVEIGMTAATIEPPFQESDIAEIEALYQEISEMLKEAAAVGLSVHSTADMQQQTRLRIELRWRIEERQRLLKAWAPLEDTFRQHHIFFGVSIEEKCALPSVEAIQMHVEEQFEWLRQTVQLFSPEETPNADGIPLWYRQRMRYPLSQQQHNQLWAEFTFDQQWREKLEEMHQWFSESEKARFPIPHPPIQQSFIVEKMPDFRRCYQRKWLRRALVSSCKQMMIFVRETPERSQEYFLLSNFALSAVMVIVPIAWMVTQADVRIQSIPGLQTLGNYLYFSDVIVTIVGIFVVSIVIRRPILRMSVRNILFISMFSFALCSILIFYGRSI